MAFDGLRHPVKKKFLFQKRIIGFPGLFPLKKLPQMMKVKSRQGHLGLPTDDLSSHSKMNMIGSNNLKHTLKRSSSSSSVRLTLKKRISVLFWAWERARNLDVRSLCHLRRNWRSFPFSLSLSLFSLSLSLSLSPHTHVAKIFIFLFLSPTGDEKSGMKKEACHLTPLVLFRGTFYFHFFAQKRKE